jgi:hypothetical protein
MKRNSKPFSVEIKKSRIQSDRIHLPPKHLFEGLQAEISRIFEKDVSQAVAEPSAPSRRILPSIIEPFSSSSEPVETDQRKHSVAAAPLAQIKFDWSEVVPEDTEDRHAQAPVRVEPRSEIPVSATVAEGVAPVRDIPSAGRDSAQANTRKARKKTYKPAEATVSYGSLSQPERLPAAEVAQTAVSERPFRSSDRRQIDRQAAAAQLPRQERWKRRLPSAAW